MCKMLIFFKHQLKEQLRSPFWQKSLWLNLLLAFFGLYMTISIAFLGYFADVILMNAFPDRDPVEVWLKLVFYLLLFDMLFRILFIKIPVLSIRPYLVLPVKRQMLWHYPLIKSIPTFYNLIPMLLILPFFIKVICVRFPGYFCFSWLLTISCLFGANIFLNFFLKKLFVKKPIWVLLIFTLVLVSFILDVRGTVNIAGYFLKAFLFMTETPGLFMVPALYLAFSYYLGYIMLKKNRYPETESSRQSQHTGNFSFRMRYGETGNLLLNEIKLILRNMRPKSMLLICLFMIVYAWYAYSHSFGKTSLAQAIILGFLITGVFPMCYGQFCFQWEGCFFDSYLSNKISILNYLRSKYLLFALGGLLTYLLTLPFMLGGAVIGTVNLVMLIYNTGITSVIVLFIATFNTTSIDLGKSQFMNYQGQSLIQWVMWIPVFGLPALIFLIAWLCGISDYAVWLFGGMGVVSIVFHSYLLKIVANQLIRRKYKMASGFRQI